MFSNILYIGTDPEGKGGMATVMRFYRDIAGDQFRFICVHRFENKFWQLLRAIRAFLYLLYYCTCTPVRLVHIQTASYRSFYRDSLYLLFAKFLGKKIILHLHGGEFELFYHQSPRYCAFICKKADCLVAVSKYFVQVFQDLDLNSNIVCLYNPIHLPSIDSDKVCMNSQCRDKLNITFLGTINKEKGVFDIMHCMHSYRDFFSTRVHLHLAGIGEQDKLNALIRQYGMEDWVTYHGWLDTDAKEKLFRVTDIYLQPSYFESLGIAILEAMSYGIPVIATRVGGIPELVHHEDNGFLIDPVDIDQLFSGIRSMIENPDLRRRFGERSWVYAQSFSEQSIERKAQELYMSL